MDTIQFLSINGTQIKYSEYGAGKIALIFVHAGIADSSMWDDQLAAFSDHFRVITYDMRGYGFSPLVPGAYSHHEDLVALMDALGVDRGVLVGCSKGGGVVFDTALAVPARIAGLVVVAGQAHGLELENQPDPPPQWDELVQAFKDGDLEKTNELEVQIWVDGYQQPAGRADQKIREKVRAMNAVVLQHEADAPETKVNVLEPKAADRLNEIAAPVLFISGTLDDPFIVQAIEKMLPEIPQARHITMQDVAHLPNMESPKEFNDHILNFVRDAIGG